MRYLLLIGLALSTEAIAVDINQLMANDPQPQQAALFPPPGPFPTKKALLGAVSSGEFRRAFVSVDDPKAGQVWYSVLNVLQNDYGLRKIADKKTYENDYCLDNSEFLGLRELVSLADYRLDSSNEGSRAYFQEMQKALEGWCDGVSNSLPLPYSPYGSQFLSSFKRFLQDYSDAIDVYIALLEQQRQVAEKAAAQAAAQREVDQARKAARLAEEQSKEKAEIDARTTEREARKKHLDACLASTSYKLLQASWRVEQGVRMVKSGQAAIDHDDEVEKVSGTVNLDVRHQAGESIVSGKKLVAESFADYKNLGGNASAPENLRAGPDPCEQYR